MGGSVGVDKSAAYEHEFSFRDDDIVDAALVHSFSFSNSKRQESGISLVDEANLKTLKMIKPTFLDVPFIHSSPFGMYRFEKMLMKGRWSNIHRGVLIKESRVVLIKEVMLSNLNKNDVVNLKYDMNVFSQLEHPNLVRLLSVHSPPIKSAHHVSKLFQVQEYLSGQKLIPSLSKMDVLFESDIQKLLAQLLSAVQYLHVRGVVHNCINTDNLMFDSDYVSGFAHLKLINFSYCECECIPRRDRRLNPVTAFTAPELASGASKTPCTKTDMYSVGAVLHVLLTGRKPSTYMPLMQAFESREFSSVSPLARNLLCQLLEENPARRSSADEALKHPWLRGSVLAKAQRPTYNTYTGSTSTMTTSFVGLESQSADTTSPGRGLRPSATPTNGSRRLSGHHPCIHEESECDQWNDGDVNGDFSGGGGGVAPVTAAALHGVGDLSNNLYLLREYRLM